MFGGQRLRGKSVLLTGAASGIGQASAYRLADKGCALLLVDVDPRGLEQTAATCRSRGAAVHTRIVDLGDEAAVRELAAGAVEALGELDVLWNNAGVMVAGQVARMSDEDWEWITAVNLRAPLLLTRLLLPRMLERGSGHVVTTASMAGLAASPGAAAYAMTKFALVGFFEGLRPEVVPRGVHTTVICPGMVRTPLFREGRLKDAAFRASVERAPRWYGLSADRVARCSIRAIERRRALAPIGAESLTWWLKRVSPWAYDLFNRGFGRLLLDGPTEGSDES